MTAPDLSKPTENGRFYVHPGNGAEVPSITNVIGMKDKPALKYWAAREAATFASKNLSTLAALSEAERIDLIKGAPFRKSNQASDTGNSVHDWIDCYIKTGNAPTQALLSASSPTARNMWRQFSAVVMKYNIHFIRSEFTVWSDKHNYAGTADWEGTMVTKQGETLHILGDTKTGKGVYPEVGMQLSAIQFADYIIDVQDGEPVQVPVPKYNRYGVLHVRPRGASLIPVKNVDACFQSFLGLRAAFEWHVRYAKHDVLGSAPKITATDKEAE